MDSVLNNPQRLICHKHSFGRLELQKMCYHLGWRLMRAGYRTCFHTLYDEKKYIYISSSSCCAASTDIPDPLSPLFPIVHRLWQVFWATSRILTQLLYVCSSWSSCFSSAICEGPYEYITYELVSAPPAVSCVPTRVNMP